MTQAQALKILKTGVNVYLTGSAGSGKTYVLNQYIKYLKDHDVPVAVTASTGIAATHMNGMTIHGWSGIGVRDTLSEYDLEALLDKQYLYKRFNQARVLIIDEVSMLHGFRLDMVNKVCQMFKKSSQPFGGLQVVLSGDFFQLPPVNRGGKSEQSDMVVYSDAWKAMKPAICYLTEQHRQDDDKFTDILNSIRKDNLQDTHLKEVEKRMHASITHVEPTKLYTHNADVDMINIQALNKLEEKEYGYEMSGRGSDVLVDILKKSCLAHEKLILKKGAQVMFVKNNFDRGYVNGTRGVVVNFLRDGTPIVKTVNGDEIEVVEESWAIEEDGKIKAEISQLPLRLAWAITIHKSQGMSLDAAEIDLGKTFEYGMGYVALSRVKALSGVRLVGLHKDALKIDPNVLELDEKFQEESFENEVLFGKLNNEAQKKMEETFILQMGGTLVPQEKGKKNIKVKTPTIIETKNMYEKGASIEEIADARGVTKGTIISHFFDLVEGGHLDKNDLERIKPRDEVIDVVGKYLNRNEGKLTKTKFDLQKLGYDMTYDEIKLTSIFCKK